MVSSRFCLIFKTIVVGYELEAPDLFSHLAAKSHKLWFSSPLSLRALTRTNGKDDGWSAWSDCHTTRVLDFGCPDWADCLASFVSSSLPSPLYCTCFLSQFYNFISESKSILKRKSILNFRLLSSEFLSKIQEHDSYVSNTLYP